MMESRKKKVRTSATERLDRRYLLIEAGDAKEVNGAILSFSGELGFSQAAPLEIDIKGRELGEGEHVIAINRNKLDLVRAAIELSGSRIAIKKVSGTLKGLFS